MSFPSLSAGTGPAAFVLVGGLLVAASITAGWYLIVAGFVLSALWAVRFR